MMFSEPMQVIGGVSLVIGFALFVVGVISCARMSRALKNNNHAAGELPTAIPLSAHTGCLDRRPVNVYPTTTVYQTQQTDFQPQFHAPSPPHYTIEPVGMYTPPYPFNPENVQPMIPSCPSQRTEDVFSASPPSYDECVKNDRLSIAACEWLKTFCDSAWRLEALRSTFSLACSRVAGYWESDNQWSRIVVQQSRFFVEGTKVTAYD